MGMEGRWGGGGRQGGCAGGGCAGEGGKGKEDGGWKIEDGRGGGGVKMGGGGFVLFSFLIAGEEFSGIGERQ